MDRAERPVLAMPKHRKEKKERKEKKKREKSGKSGRREVKFIGVCFSASEGVNNKGVARGVLECP